jgi:hypothetical protein
MKYTITYGVTHKGKWAVKDAKTLFHREQAIKECVELALKARQCNASGKMPQGYKCVVATANCVENNLKESFEFFCEVYDILETKALGTAYEQPEGVGEVYLQG